MPNPKGNPVRAQARCSETPRPRSSSVRLPNSEISSSGFLCPCAPDFLQPFSYYPPGLSMDEQFKNRLRAARAERLLEEWESIEEARERYEEVERIARQAIGRKIAELREEMGLTQQDVADKICQQLERTRKGTAGLVQQVEDHCGTLTVERLGMILNAILSA